MRLQQLMARGAVPEAEVDMLLSKPGVSAASRAGLALGTLLSVPFLSGPALVHWADPGADQPPFSGMLAVWRRRGAFFVYVMPCDGLVPASASARRCCWACSA